MVPDKKNTLYLSQTKNQANDYKEMATRMGEKKNHLFQVQPILKERKLDPKITWREETILARRRIGHTKLTHSFILKDEPSSKRPCGNQFIIKHILIEWTKLTNIRRRFYDADNRNKLFRTINPKQVLKFLKKKSAFYQKCPLMYFFHTHYYLAVWKQITNIR